jgi:alpha-amylase
LTETLGCLLKVFPARPALANAISFAQPSVILDYLKRLAEARPGSTIVFAVDGEMFGSRTSTASYANMIDWIERFCELTMSSGNWLGTVTLATATNRSLPLGKIYFSDNAYRYRNLQARCAPSDEMYARMLGVSQRLTAAERDLESDPDYLEAARLELYRGQCGSAYGNGTSGGIGVPHLRHAVYRQLIAADNALDEIEGKGGPRVQADVGDFNLDGRQEVRLENDHLIALCRPACGGHIYELDLREQLTNVLATFDRVPEADEHGTIRQRQKARDHRVYDRHPRKALVDHFFPVEVTIQDVAGGRDVDCGDFALGTFQAKVRRETRRVAVIMDRGGRAGDRSIRIRKTIELAAGESRLSIRYEIEEIPADACLHFGAEINLAGLSGQASGACYSDPTGAKLGPLDSRLDLPHAGGITVSDPATNLAFALTWSQAAGLWCFPIETSGQGEGEFETILQSSAVIPHWHVMPDERGRWEVSIEWGFEPGRAGDWKADGRDRAALVSGTSR